MEALLTELTGAEAAIGVNNGAAAVLLAVAALAGPGKSIVISRGQLVEIGGGFRIPEVIAQSGATMIEVGTTNRTRLGDYEQALADPEHSGGDPARAPFQLPFPGVRRGCLDRGPVRTGCAVIDDAGSGVLAGPAAGSPRLPRSLR